MNTLANKKPPVRRGKRGLEKGGFWRGVFNAPEGGFQRGGLFLLSLAFLARLVFPFLGEQRPGDGPYFVVVSAHEAAEFVFSVVYPDFAVACPSPQIFARGMGDRRDCAPQLRHRKVDRVRPSPIRQL